MSWMKLTPALTKSLTADWNRSFPAFAAYAPMQLLRRAGPLLMGVCLNRSQDNLTYSPIFHVHPLTRVLEEIILGQPRMIPNALVHVEWHDSKLEELASRLASRAYLPLTGKLRLEDVVSGFSSYLEEPFAPYEPEVYLDLACICRWCGAPEKSEEALRVGEAVMARWPPRVLDGMGGLDAWIREARRLAEDRDRLRATVDQQVVALKLGAIPDAGLEL